MQFNILFPIAPPFFTSIPILPVRIYQQLLKLLKLHISQSLSSTMIETQQSYFAEELDFIQQIYIKTSYGNIFAQAVGKHGQPLIIVVHGSGPRNSSDQYSYLLHEYLVRISYLEKFFVIAIDCPGYGRSKGSKEAIKTFPLQMFRQILKDLNYSSYFAMFGHSQGGAAIFHAVHEDPTLTEFLLMDRPVCGNIKRFNKFPIPTLLVYDIEDDGHPLWQGKLLFKQLLKSQFYTYRNSKDPYYVPDNIWNLILYFIQRYSTQRKGIMTQSHRRNRSLNFNSESPKKMEKRSTNKFIKQKPLNNSMDKYQQVKKNEQKREETISEIKEIDRSELYSMMAEDLEEFEELPSQLNQPKVEQTVQEEQEERERQMIKKEKLRSGEKRSDEEGEKISEKEKMHIGQRREIKKEQKKSEKEKQNSKTEQKEQNCCAICYDRLFYPIQTNCKHIFCKKCIGESYLVNQKCPLCRAEITQRTLKQSLHQILIEQMPKEEITKRQKELNKFQEMLKSIFYIEIGNRSRQLTTKQSHFSKTKKKYMWEIYAKEPKNFKFEEVSFNINMGQANSKPIKVSSAPFTFESRGTFSFSCEVTVKPRNRDYAPLTSIYRIDITPGNHSKLIAIKKKNI